MFYLWKFTTDVTAVLFEASPNMDALLGKDNIDACTLDAWHFDFVGPWLGESAPLQRLTI